MEEYKDREYVILRTYKSVWKVPKKIYSIDNIKLLFPINPEEMLYFLVSEAIAFILFKILPFLNGLPFILKYAALPYGIMKFLTKQKLDGKLPHKFFIDYLIFVFSPKKGARYQDIQPYKSMKFVTPIVARDIEIINRTEQALKTLKRKGRKK